MSYDYKPQHHPYPEASDGSMWAQPSYGGPSGDPGSMPPRQRASHPAPDGDDNRRHRPVSGTDWDRLIAPPAMSEHDGLWAPRRRSVGSALQAINGRRASQAYASLAYKQPLSPHGVCLFYVESDSRHIGGLQVYTAARWEFASPLNSNLPGFLSELTDTAMRFAHQAERRRSRWDPRGPDKPLVNKGDEDIPQHAEYIGVGVETLDTADQSWADRVGLARTDGQQRFDVTLNFPGEAVAVLTDGSVLRAIREPGRSFSYLHANVWCTRPLDADRPLMRTDNVLDRLGPTLAGAWPQIAALGQFMHELYSSPS